MTVKWNGASVVHAVQQAAMRGVVRGTEGVLAEATSMILSGDKTGRIYRRRGVEHQASAPGEAPASDTGALVQSGQTSYSTAEISGTVNWSSKHAEPLERGTEEMEPRPFARPALAARKDAIEADVAAEIKAAIT